MNIMKCSIQEYLKKINSRLTLFNCLSLLGTVISLGGFLFFLYEQKKMNDTPVSYLEYKDKGVDNENVRIGIDSRPFASVYGKTYTFFWCQGSQLISAKNRIYFVTESEAKSSGRTLSKLCKK